MASNDHALAQELRNISERYLTAGLTDNERAIGELVSDITQRFILPNLREYCSDVSYMGSAYEYTTVPGKSDYDIQFFIKLPRGQRPEVVMSGDPAWAFVRGGPSNLLDNGYLSTDKARGMIISQVDKALQQHGGSMTFRGDRVTIRRSYSGPAITLNVEWKQERVSIDVVVCLKAGDLLNGEFDLVAKPNDRAVSDADKYWRLSYSKYELARLREFHQCSPRKLILLRIMKVIKEHQAQLGVFPSFFYKNILFKMCEDNPRAGWERGDLAPRFKEMIQTIHRALQTQRLPLCFNKRVNYLAGKSNPTLENYLMRIINSDRYIDLVRVVPEVRR